MRNTSTRLLASLSFFGLLATSAFAGGIKHPSDYGVDPLVTCGTLPGGLLTATCYEGSGGFADDLLINFSLISPAAGLTSATFDFSALPTDFGLVEGTSGDPCAGDNIDVPCGPDTSPVTIADSSPLALTNNKFTFTNFTSDQTVTAWFSFNEAATGVTATLTADNTSGATTGTPEPSEIGILIAAFGCLVAARRKLQAKRNS
jgi:hypothetical protein